MATPPEIQAWQDRVINACNTFDNHVISPDVCASCQDCQSDFGRNEAELLADTPADEGGFSWRACECCGSSLGGNRYSAHAFQGGELCHLSICEDCVLYLANGDLPMCVD